MHALEEVYESDQVQEFMSRYDSINIERIASGLDSAKATLLDVAPDERKMSALNLMEMFALFESMHCLPLLQNDALLIRHFDQPFRLVQSKTRISLPEYSPALTSFLFSNTPERSEWAFRGWRKFKRNITAPEFDWAVKETLTRAIDRVKITSLDREFMPAFWQAVHAILRKLDGNVIRHHLRSIDADICLLALDHLQVDSGCLLDLLSSLKLFWEKAPADTWESFSKVNAQTVVEQIFNSPTFGKLLYEDQSASQDLDTALSWIDAMLRSVKDVALPAAYRAITTQLLIRFQREDLPTPTRELCSTKGEQTILLVLALLQANVETQQSGAQVASLLDVIASHLAELLRDRKYSHGQKTDSADAAIQIVQQTMTLACHGLQLDRRAAVLGKVITHDMGLASLTSIWQIISRNLRSGNVRLACAALQGATESLVLEKLTEEQVKCSPKIGSQWNAAVSQVHQSLVDLLEHMQDFPIAALQQIFAGEDETTAIFAQLFSGDSGVQQAATSVLKAASLESSRRECIRYLLSSNYTTTLHAMSTTLRAIASAKVLTPSLMVLKLGTDFIESLCNSEDGVLRSRKLDEAESGSTEAAWAAMWTAISVIFEHTEAWSTMGYDKSLLVEFCRDTMDYALKTFDQYSIISGALHVVDSSKDKTELDKRLLSRPKEAADHMMKWLRLRDDYLIAKAVTLASRVMGRLHDVGLELSELAINFIDDIAAGATKNKLTTVQRAELRRALDDHLDDGSKSGAADDDVIVVEKPQKQGSLTKWVSDTGTGRVTVPERSGGIDFDSWKKKADQKTGRIPETLVPREKAQKFSKQETRAPAAAVPRAPTPKIEDPGAFKRKRQAEQEAKRKRDLAAIAAVKGTRIGIGEAGSGLTGIGIEGKMHAAKGEGVMVSSEEDSDDDGLDEELFGTSKAAKPEITKKTAAVIRQEPRKPVRLQRLQRSQKDMQARLKPDLSALHKLLLGWDIFHTGDYPPNANVEQYQKVASSFRHVEAYRDTFRDLLTLEAWQGFVRAREESISKPYTLKIANRTNVDNFIEVSTAISPADNRDLHLSEGDIILLSAAANPANDADAAHCLSRIHRVNKKKGMLEVIYRITGGGAGLSARLLPNTTAHGCKLTNIVPLEREYGALIGLQYYDLCTQIIKAQPSPLLDYTDKQIEPLMTNYAVNKAQAKAVKSAVDNDAFTLIQGPPGSGKTKTIIAIVGALIGDHVFASDGATQIKAPKAISHDAYAAPRKLMVCAPSNAAVDELVVRLKEGIKTTRGVKKPINVLRLGRSEAINSAVVDVTLDELVNKRLGSSNADVAAREKMQAIMSRHQNISEQLRNAREKLDKGSSSPGLAEKISQLRKTKNDLGNQIDSAKDAEGAAHRTADLQRRKVQQAVLDESHVICATLSGSGHDMFQSLNIEFETVIVDEAAQCVEMSALIPLKYGCAKCILVGDPKQLPPTVFSKEAARFQYEQSLFVRMQANYPESVHLLDTQYRMHPDISAFPSASFYDGRLLDGPGMAALRKQPWHASSLLAPYRFFDVQGQHSTAPKGHSLFNRAEVDVAMALYAKLIREYADYDFKHKIGIITPYKSQLGLLKDRFSQQYGKSITEEVDFNTTDAFQGRESEIIIFSCVRASPAGSIGFLQDIRRMNVGLTRAKSSLWVLGHGQSLSRGEYWKKLVVNAQERGSYITGNLLSMLQKPDKAREAIRVDSESNGHAAGDPRLAGREDRQMVKQEASKKVGSPAVVPVKLEKGQVRSNGKHDGMSENKHETKSALRHEVKSEVKTEAKLENKEPRDTKADINVINSSRSGTPAYTSEVDSDSRASTTSVRPSHTNGARPASGHRPGLPNTSASTAPHVPRKRKPTDVFMPRPNKQKR